MSVMTISQVTFGVYCFFFSTNKEKNHILGMLVYNSLNLRKEKGQAYKYDIEINKNINDVLT